MMLRILFSTMCFITWFGTFSQAQSNTANHILTEANFESLTANDSWMLEFFAPWCGHCKALAPAWERAASAMLNTGINFGSVDCTVEKSLCKRFGVKGYPTIKFLRDGVTRNYQSGRTYNDLVAFGRSLLTPAVTDVRAESSIYSLLDDPNWPQRSAFVLVGHDEVVSRLFSRLARQMQGLARFLQYPKPHQQFVKQFIPQASSDNTPFMLYYSQDDSPQLYTGSRLSLDEMRQFVEQRRLPLISALTGDNFEDLTNSAAQMNKKLAFYIYHPANTTHLSAFTSRIRPLALSRRDNLLIATVNATQYSRWLTQFVDVSPINLPTLIVFDSFPDTVHTPSSTGAQSIEQVQTMLTDIVENKRSPRSSLPFYSPQRYLRPMERWLNQFEEWQIIAGVVGLSAVIFGIVFWFCSTTLEDAPSAPAQPRQPVVTEAKPADESEEEEEEEHEVQTDVRKRK